MTYDPNNNKNQGTDSNKNTDETENEEFPGYPIYPPEEDIYANDLEEVDLDPEDPNHLKTPNEKQETPDETEFDRPKMGGDLDIPGSELDDENEEIGEEDEENNYYS